MALNTVNVICDIYDGGKNLLAGAGFWLPSVAVTDASDHVLVAPSAALVAQFQVTGQPQVPLLACDNAALLPSGWRWSFIPPSGWGLSAQTFNVQAGPVAFTATSASPCVFTASAPAGQPWTDGQQVVLSGASLPAGFTAGTYYLTGSSGSTFSLAAAPGGPAIGSTSTGSGSITVGSVYLSQMTPVSSAVSTFPLNPMTAAGDLIYGGSSPAGIPERLGIGTAGEVLTVTSGLPAWGPAPSSLPLTTLGDTLYEDGTPAAARLPGNTTATRKFYRQAGTGTVSAAPAWDTLQSGDLPLLSGVPLAPLPAVAVTTTGATFSPVTALAQGSTATVSWAEGGAVVATGVAPVINFGSAATRTVYMYASRADGSSALGDVILFNIGYNSNNDSSIYAPSASYNLAAQAVSGVAGIRNMTGLQLFLAEQVTGLSGTLDFTGLSQLTNIELFGSTGVAGVITEGCQALQRLDQEACSVTSTNLNAVRSMYDFRSAAQNGGYQTIQPLQGPLLNQYHFCVRDQVVYGMPDFATDMPAINQLWPWNTVQSGALKVRSTSLTSLQAYHNWYVSADLASQFPRVAASPADLLDLHSNQLTSVTITGCPGLGSIDLSSNQLSQSQVDGILAAVDGFGTSGGTLNLAGNAAPSATGQTHATNLRGRAWTVTVASSGGPVGTRWTFGENVMVRVGSGGPGHIQASLASAVAAGDLLVAAVETQSTPVVYDSSGNTWTVIGPYGSFVYLAYCLSAAASGTGLTVTAYGGQPSGFAVGRYTPAAAAAFGGAAGSTPSAGGLNAGATNNLGDLGIVPAHALAWGVLFDDSTAVQSYSTGFQSGSAGTPDLLGFSIPGPNLYGGGIILYVLDTANADAAMTWLGGGTGATGWAASAYFTA